MLCSLLGSMLVERVEPRVFRRKVVDIVSHCSACRESLVRLWRGSLACLE